VNELRAQLRGHHLVWVVDVMLPATGSGEEVLLGHQHLSTTARYTQVATTTIGNTTSPFDRLEMATATPD